MHLPELRVLLVDDNPIEARLAEAELLDRTEPIFLVDKAETLADAVQRLGAGGIDVVLLDLTLPDSQDVDTYVATRAAAPNVPIVVITGLDDLDLAVELIRRGAQDCLVKGDTGRHGLARALLFATERPSPSVR